MKKLMCAISAAALISAAGSALAQESNPNGDPSADSDAKLGTANCGGLVRAMLANQYGGIGEPGAATGEEAVGLVAQTRDYGEARAPCEERLTPPSQFQPD